MSFNSAFSASPDKTMADIKHFTSSVTGAVLSVLSVNQPVPPSFTHPLPRSINVTKGEPVRITCVADGNPVPDVMWFDNGEPIGVPAQGSNQLYIANIRSSTMLTCRASSQYGNIEASTRVNLLQGEWTRHFAYDGAFKQLSRRLFRSTSL